VTENALGDTPQGPPLDTRPSMSAHSHEVYVFLLSMIQNLEGLMTVAHVAGDFQPRFRKACTCLSVGSAPGKV
jgi:hypothetical protein